jgi:hypothetical protein
MKRTSLFLIMVAVALAATAPAQPDLIARIHFLGGDKIAADPNHLAFMVEFASTEAKALESQTLDKLSRAPGQWFKSKIPAGAGDGAAQLRPLLDDLLKSEWIFEMRDAPGSPEYALAIRLDNERAQVWQNNLQRLLEAWTKLPAQKIQNGWQLRKHEPPDLIQFSRTGDGVVVDCGQGKLTLAGEILPAPGKSAAAETNWLSADLNWPRLAQIFPKLKIFDFPRIQMTVIGRDKDLDVIGKLLLSHPLPPLEKWQLPTDVIHQPLVSFTAARGVGPWLARQSWMKLMQLDPQPDQVFIWALAQIPFQTFAAEPVPDADAALAQLDRNLTVSTGWQSHFITAPEVVMTNHEISLRSVPFISPFVQAVKAPDGQFLFGGLFPNLPKSKPLPPELFAALNRPGLVYYHWEETGARLGKMPSLKLPQLSQLLLMLTEHRQLDAQSPAFKWLNQIGATLGITVTEVTQSGPEELTFKRRAPGGLTAIELVALANWIEAPNFPGCDLRLPERPRLQRLHSPMHGMPAMPAPAPPAKH